MENSPEKICTTCKVSLPLINFYKDKITKDGYRPICKSCTNSKNAEYREKNKERLALQKVEYRKKNKERAFKYNAEYHEKNKERLALRATEYRKENKERITSWHAEYRERNKELIASRNAEYREKNKEHLALWHAEYRKNNPEISRAKKHRRRANKRKAGGSFTPEQITQQDQRQKNKCYYCHKKMGSSRTIEHVIPLSRGGSNDISNIVLACMKCNFSKNAKLPHEWPQGGRLL